jgi:hypothetical protein
MNLTNRGAVFMVLSRVAAIATLGVCLSASAAVTPAIVSAEASDDLVVGFVVRTTNDVRLSTVRLTVSGEEFPAIPEYEKARPPVSPHILIDLGPPVTPFQPTISPAMLASIQRLASRGKLARPEWTFQFIAGDHNLCRLSESFAASSVAAHVTPKALQALVTNGLPLNREDIGAMRDLFADTTRTHTLVVLASAPPVWLARETTEWMTRDTQSDVATRRVLGRDAQWRLKGGESSAIRDITNWIAAGHLIPIVVPTLEEPALPPEWAPLRHGTEEILARVHTFRNADEVLTTQLLEPMTEHRGTIRIPLIKLQRPASGIYTVQLIARDAKGNESSSHAVHALDRALRTRRPELLWAYIMVLVAITIVLFGTWAWHHGQREPPDLDAEFSDLMFKVTSGFGGITLGICTALISSTDAPSLWVSAVALITGVLALGLGAVFWYAKHEQLLTGRTL